jgi:hypothetical protein
MQLLCTIIITGTFNIPISLFGAVGDSGEVGYVMEYCPNGSLYHYSGRRVLST